MVRRHNDGYILIVLFTFYCPSIELIIGFEIANYAIPEPDGPIEVCLTEKSGNAIETILPTITIRYDDIEAAGELI